MEVNEDKKNPEPFALNWYHSVAKKDRYYLYVEPIWGVDIPYKDKTQKAVEKFLEKKIKKDIKKDSIRIEVTSVKKAMVIFNVDKWLRENFLKNPKVEFNMPRTLIWSFKKDLPDIIKSRVMWFELENFLADSFKSFLKDHKKKIFESKFKMAKKLNFNWFDFEVDMKMKKIYVRMKTTVMMTLAIGAYAVTTMGKNKQVDSFREYDL